MTTHLQRLAAVVPVFVQAGCEEPEYALCQEDDGTVHALRTPHGQYVSIDAVPLGISYYKEWLYETVVPWCLRQYLIRINLPRPRVTPGFWDWAIDGVPNKSTGRINGTGPDPTEAFTQCAEALAKVIGGEG